MQLMAQLECLAKAAGVPEQVLYVEASAAWEAAGAAKAAATALAKALPTASAAHDIEVIEDDAVAAAVQSETPAAETEAAICPICESNLQDGDGHEPLACTHMFHSACLQRQAATLSVRLRELRCAVCRRSAADVDRMQQLQLAPPPPRLRRGGTFVQTREPKVSAAPAKKGAHALPKHVLQPPLPPQQQRGQDAPLSSILQQIADAADGEEIGMDGGSSSGTAARFSVELI